MARVIARRRAAIVTDRPAAVAGLRRALEGAGYGVEVVGDGEPSPSVDLLLVDVGSERLWPVAESADGRRILIVDHPAQFDRAFGLGADDCVSIDADPLEVAARCDAVLRRTNRRPERRSDPAVFVDERLWINFGSRQVWVAGSPVHLTPREFRLLRFLIQHRGERLSHARILEAVWGRPLAGDRPTEVLKQYIWRLRQKIEEDPEQPATIVTDAGEGYRFVAHTA